MTTEVEIFDILSQSFREAAERCVQLAWNPRRGFIYLAFLKNLKAIEGACMQAAQHREDGRWFPVGMMMANVHEYAGTMIRASRTRDERNKAVSFFRELGEHLRGFHYEAEKMRDAKVGPSAPERYERFGTALLPSPEEGPHRPVRPVQVLRPKGGEPAKWTGVPALTPSLILPGDPRYQ